MIEDFKSARRQIIKHLMKIFYYRSFTESKKHWIGEVHDFLHESGTLKGSNKKPKKSFIFEYLWEEKKEVFENNHDKFVRELNRKYSGDFYEVTSDSNCVKFCRDYMEWLSERLSMEDFLEYEEVEREIEELLKNYPLR